jgi:hypothetical protein
LQEGDDDRQAGYDLSGALLGIVIAYDGASNDHPAGKTDALQDAGGD